MHGGDVLYVRPRPSVSGNIGNILHLYSIMSKNLKQAGDSY
jgi:hypothetical protein